MPAPKKSLTVGAFTYVVALLPAEEGLEPLGRLLAIIAKPAAKALLSGDAVSAIMAGVKADAKLDDAFVASMAKPLGEALDGILGALEPRDLRYFSDVFKGHTMVCKAGEREGVPLDGLFSDHFAGNYGAWREWVTFCLKENFASFLGGNSAISRALAAARQKAAGAGQADE